MITSTFKKSHHLHSINYSCHLEIDRQDQSLFIFDQNNNVHTFKRGLVLEALLNQDQQLTLKDFFLYQLDREENSDHRSVIPLKNSTCRCFFVTEEMIQKNMNLGQTAFGVSESTGAGSLCGKCLPDLCRTFFQRRSDWKYDQQKVRSKNCTPAELVLFLGETFPHLIVEEFFENCLYYQKSELTIDTKIIQNEIWQKFKERIIFVEVN